MTSGLSGKKALVMGSDMRAFLTVVRSLGRAGIEVHVAWAAPGSPALRSRYVRQITALPKPWPGNDEWQTALLDALEKERYDLVVPCNDASLIPLHENRAVFERYPVCLLNERAYATVFDKARTGQLVRSLGVPSPRERLITSDHEVECLDEFVPPFVLKPTRSFLPTDLRSKQHVVVASTIQEARETLRELLQASEVLVQEYFRGTGVGLEFLAEDGEILVGFQHVRLHEPRAGGGSSYRRSAALHPELRSATARIVRALDYSGVGMAEFIYDFPTDRWVFLEVNGRFWGSLPLAVAAGVDFPAISSRQPPRHGGSFRRSIATTWPAAT